MFYYPYKVVRLLGNFSIPKAKFLIINDAIDYALQDCARYTHPGASSGVFAVLENRAPLFLKPFIPSKVIFSCEDNKVLVNKSGVTLKY